MASPRHAGTGHARWVVIAPFLTSVALLCLLAVGIVDLLSAARAYVGGESLYSKGQKEALYYLTRFAQTRAPADYQRFEAAIAVPLGDAIARTELERPVPDLDRVRAGFLQAGNHPDDIDAMIRLYRHFGGIGPVARAIAIWADGDGAVAELVALARRVRALAAAGDPAAPEMAALLDRLPALNARLSDLEERFSATLGEASRLMQRVVLVATAALGSLLAFGGVLLTSGLMRRRAFAEAALRESHARWEMAAAAAQIGLLDWQLGTDRVLLDAHAAALFDLPAAPEQAADGARLLAAVHPDDRARLREALARAVASGQPLELRYRVGTADGEARHHELRARAGSGAPRVVGIVRDVTADVQRAQLRLEKQAAERANAAKTELLSRVSHALRTPLNAVIGFAELLLTDRRAALAPAQQQRVQHIRQAGTHLLTLVDDVLDLAALDAGVPVAEATALDLDAIVDESRRAIEPQAGAAGITLVVQPTRASVRADADRLRQVIAQLLSNAVKFNRPQGRVTVQPVSQADARWCVLSVCDTGRGLTASEIERLFEPFERGAAERDGIPGSGIGLLRAQRLVERMGGRLEVRSTPGEGSDFRLWLRADADEPA